MWSNGNIILILIIICQFLSTNKFHPMKNDENLKKSVGTDLFTVCQCQAVYYSFLCHLSSIISSITVGRQASSYTRSSWCRIMSETQTHKHKYCNWVTNNDDCTVCVWRFGCVYVCVDACNDICESHSFSVANDQWPNHRHASDADKYCTRASILVDDISSNSNSILHRSHVFLCLFSEQSLQDSTYECSTDR